MEMNWKTATPRDMLVLLADSQIKKVMASLEQGYTQSIQAPWVPITKAQARLMLRTWNDLVIVPGFEPFGYVLAGDTIYWLAYDRD